MVDFTINNDDSGVAVIAQVVGACHIRLELYRMNNPSMPPISQLFNSRVEPGKLEQHIQEAELRGAYMLYLSVNDDEFYLHRMH